MSGDTATTIMADANDYHIDPKLERLFHGDQSGLLQDDEESAEAEKLPEWLIGVIVVIIILIIAFFVMMISSIIKNKNKNRSSDCSNDGSSSNVCDDLELGKISQVDPKYQMTAFIAGGQSRGQRPAPEEVFESNCQPSASSSSDSPGGSQHLSGCKNPLFLDVEVETEDDNCRESDSRTVEVSCNSPKTQCHKQKSSIRATCLEPNSLSGAISDDNPSNVAMKTNGEETASNSESESLALNRHNCISSHSMTMDDEDRNIQVHCSDEVDGSKDESLSSKTGNPEEVGNKLLAIDDDVSSSYIGIDCSKLCGEEKISATDMGTISARDLSSEDGESNQTGHVMVEIDLQSAVDPQPSNETSKSSLLNNELYNKKEKEPSSIPREKSSHARSRSPEMPKEPEDAQHNSDLASGSSPRTHDAAPDLEIIEKTYTKL